MGLVELIDKLITEHGSSIIQDKHIALLREQATVEAIKLSNITAECESLRADNTSLREQLSSLTSTQNYEAYNGLLWLPLESGGYENSPYCPKCKVVMHETPPRSIMRPMYWTCLPCQVQATHCQPPEKLKT